VGPFGLAAVDGDDAVVLGSAGSPTLFAAHKYPDRRVLVEIDHPP
jgi:hypothetical protein